jgi:hypothetical protein
MHLTVKGKKNLAAGFGNFKPFLKRKCQFGRNYFPTDSDFQ